MWNAEVRKKRECSTLAPRHLLVVVSDFQRRGKRCDKNSFWQCSPVGCTAGRPKDILNMACYSCCHNSVQPSSEPLTSSYICTFFVVFSTHFIGHFLSTLLVSRLYKSSPVIIVTGPPCPAACAAVLSGLLCSLYTDMEQSCKHSPRHVT